MAQLSSCVEDTVSGCRWASFYSLAPAIQPQRGITLSGGCEFRLFWPGLGQKKKPAPSKSGN